MAEGTFRLYDTLQNLNIYIYFQNESTKKLES